MTTIAVRDGVMACDTHVSGNAGVGAIKMRKRRGIIVGFAGDWIAGVALAEHVLAGSTKGVTPHSADDLELLVLKEDGVYLLDAYFRPVKITHAYYAIGSGAECAMVAMNMGATAPEAVAEAIKVDDSTWGRVRKLSL